MKIIYSHSFKPNLCRYIGKPMAFTAIIGALIVALFNCTPAFGQKKIETQTLIARDERSVVDSIQLILVNGGTFSMGSSRNSNEQPIHTVTVKSFYIGIYEITQEQWEAVMDLNFSNFATCRKCPVTDVSWNEAQEFAAKLSKLTGRHYRLPTEAEWEYAARGGNLSAGYLYSGSNNVHEVAYTDHKDLGPYEHMPHPVGQKKANELGIYDMTGNVLEWCSDWHNDTYYSESPSSNPQGPSNGKTKVIRGGFYDSSPRAGTNTFRDTSSEALSETAHWSTLGFRLVRDL